jgi:hypothetical protein
MHPCTHDGQVYGASCKAMHAKRTGRRLRAEHDRWDMAGHAVLTGFVPLTRAEHCTRTVHVHAALHRRTHARRQTAVNAHISFAWPNSESAQSYVMQLHDCRLNATCIIARMHAWSHTWHSTRRILWQGLALAPSPTSPSAALCASARDRRTCPTRVSRRGDPSP